MKVKTFAFMASKCMSKLRNLRFWDQNSFLTSGKLSGHGSYPIHFSMNFRDKNIQYMEKMSLFEWFQSHFLSSKTHPSDSYWSFPSFGMKSAIIATSLLVADAIVMHVESGYNYGVLDRPPWNPVEILGFFGVFQLPWWQFRQFCGVTLLNI